MSYARYRAAAADVEALSGGTRLQWKLRQARAELVASLPFLGDDIFVLIAAELDARMLGRLACVAPRFWRASVPDPAHKGGGAPELWSVAEEGARRRLRAQSEQVRGWVSRQTSAGGSWLRALRQAEKLQRPLRFTAWGPEVELREDATVATRAGYWQSAVCGGHEMTAGVHCAHFEMRELYLANVGVAGPGFDPATGGWAWQSAEGWLMGTLQGKLRHGGRDSKWAGQPKDYGIKEGDVVGMVLDLDAGSLTAYLNGERLGVMVPSGLAGPLRWAVDVVRGSVRIDAQPPPAVTSEDLAEDERKQREFDARFS